MAGVDHVDAERLDERRFPGAGRAADADPHRVPGSREQFFEQRPCVLTMVVARRLDERDRTRQRAPITGPDRGGELGAVAHAFARRSRTSLRMSDAARGMLLPGPNTALTPACWRNG